LDSSRNSKKNKAHANMVITKEFEDSDAAICRIGLKIGEEKIL